MIIIQKFILSFKSFKFYNIIKIPIQEEMDKDLTEKETLALLQAKNEIIALKKQFNQIQGDVQPQEYFFKFQKEIDLFEKKITKNIKTIETNSKFISIKKKNCPK